jgi:hypothetical protein
LDGTLGPVGLAPSLDYTQIQASFRAAVDQASTNFISRGLTTPALPPGFSGDLPADYTHYDDTQLGELLGTLSSYCAFVDMEKTKSSIALRATELTLRQAKAKVILTIRALGMGGKKVTVDEREAMMECDGRVQEAEFQHLYAFSYHELVKTTLDKSRLNWDTVSRRITQRGQEVDRLRRETSVAGVQSHFRQPFGG